MPIRESERHKYPPPEEWRSIRAHILNRAGHKCEWCGAPNERFIIRFPDGSIETRSEADLDAAALDGERTVKIVLTIAHLDQDPTNNAEENLAALCQRCHLHHDRKQHMFNAARTRSRKTGQAEMPFLEPKK